jgi:hypothetical protein
VSLIAVKSTAGVPPKLTDVTDAKPVPRSTTLPATLAAPTDGARLSGGGVGAPTW